MLVVVALVPIMFLVPAPLMFLPPFMPLMPAMLPRFVQLTPLVVCLPAMASVFLHGLMKFVLCVSDSALTCVEIFRLKVGHYGGK